MIHQGGAHRRRVFSKTTEITARGQKPIKTVITSNAQKQIGANLLKNTTSLGAANQTEPTITPPSKHEHLKTPTEI